MKRISIVMLFCVAILFPSIVTAQEFSLFAKQKVVVAPVWDMNDRKLADGVKLVIRQGIIDACTNSNDYEVYEVNVDDIKRQLVASGQSTSFPNICKKIGDKADYIIFTNVKLSSSELGAQNISIYITSSLYRIATASEVRSLPVPAQPNSQSLMQATSKLVSELLGISAVPQAKQLSRPQQSTAQTSYISNNNYQQSCSQSAYSPTPQPFVENANCGLGMKMIYVEGGTFTMGDTFGNGDSDEKPTHNVTLDSFYIAESEVTQAQWVAIMGSNPSHFKGDNRPVDCVTWYDAQEFCNRLSSITGKTYILPTEAQWEYAARGGKKSRNYEYSGLYSLDAVGWYDGNSGGQTHSVKGKRPNELGIYDMSGNVYEWCQDWYGDYSSVSQTNPTGPSSGSGRVLRGGSWYNRAWLCRVSSRSNYTPSVRSGNFGFRLVLLP